MSVLIDFTYQNAEGQGVPGATVELWTGDGGTGQTKIDDATDHGQGNYSMEYSISGKYTIKVNGTAVPSMTNKFLPADDLLRQEHVDDITLEFIDNGSGDYILRIKAGGVDTSQLKDDSVTKEKVAADVAGAGLKQNSDGSFSPDTDGTTVEINESNKVIVKDNVFCKISDIVNDLTSGGTAAPLSAEQGKTLKDLLGDGDMSDNPLLEAYYFGCLAHDVVPTYTNYLHLLTYQIMSNTKGITQGTEIYNRRTIYSDYEQAAADGDSCITVTEYITDDDTSPGDIKLRGEYVKRIGDKYIELNCNAKGDVLDEYGKIILYSNGDDKSVSIISTTYSQYTIRMDISDADDGDIIEFYVHMLADVAASTIRMKNVVIDILGAA